MPKVAYDPQDANAARRQSHVGKSISGPKPCDDIQKGDLLRVGGNLRKVRAVQRCSETGYVVNVVAVKQCRSGYPSPTTHINRHRLKEATIIEREVDLYSTELESRLQVAVDRKMEALEDPADHFDIRKVITEEEVVDVLC